MMETIADWTDGAAALVYQSCDTCGEKWYFRRDFCPHCGSTRIVARMSACVGTVYAATVVVRAPSPEWREHAPYGLCLVDLDEGVRVMTQAEPGIAIGDRIRIGFRRIGPAILPVAGRMDGPAVERI